MAEQDESFLARWSRRKRGGGATPVVETPVEPSAPAAVAPEAPLVAVATPPDAEPKATAERREEVAPRDGADTAADLPDVDSLDKDSDYTGFLRKGVPEQLQKRALRKLWRSNPVFGFRDGLDDYDEDFGLFFKDAVAGAVKTAYKVGKGFVTPEEEKAEAAKAPGEAERDGADTERQTADAGVAAAAEDGGKQEGAKKRGEPT